VSENNFPYNSPLKYNYLKVWGRMNSGPIKFVYAATKETLAFCGGGG
jgi:hypothetical protein